VEILQQLTRRQVDTLRAVMAQETPEQGASLKGLASGLGVSAPSVLGHLTPLEELGLVQRHRGKSRLTDRGRTTLLEYQRHHRLVESLFGSLGMAPSESCVAAREIDLAISHRTVEEICRTQSHPTECPHGAPIAPCRPSGNGRHRSSSPRSPIEGIRS
jgi:Mn-dependent DtxR family transcriptional regulator